MSRKVKETMLNKVLIVLVIIAAACIGVLIENVNQLVQYRDCMNQPITELSARCQDVIQN